MKLKGTIQGMVLLLSIVVSTFLVGMSRRPQIEQKAPAASGPAADTFPPYALENCPYPSVIQASDTQINAKEESRSETIVLPVEGMTCTNCEAIIEKSLRGTKGVIASKANYKKGTVKVEYEPAAVRKSEITKAIERVGYKVQGKEK